MSELSPRLTDIRFRHDVLDGFDVDILDDTEYRALMRLVSYSASRMVWTYSEPTDGALKLTDQQFANITRMSLRKWLRIKLSVLGYFDERDGKLYLKNDWIQIKEGGTERPPIPAAARSYVLRRDEFTCAYCGTKDGPFDVDHVVPVSRGGSPDQEDNLICACARCNRSKGALSLDEWLRKKAGAEVS